ncbi:hypothetical protein [Planctomicrobium sp. SH664]|uniref:hypothetical protein n=1 Tax=Planctomicrobium sp. SH664 TaxID=3448125 RepID=UPI003F5BA070
MRVRLYEIGTKKTGVTLIDQFPASLEMNEQGEVCPRVKMKCGVCSLEEIGGQLVLRAARDYDGLMVNDAPLEEGPLMPGDRLRLGNRDYLISYEMTKTVQHYPRRFRIRS